MSYDEIIRILPAVVLMLEMLLRLLPTNKDYSIIGKLIWILGLLERILPDVKKWDIKNKRIEKRNTKV